MAKKTLHKYRYFILTLILIAVDQITKFWVVANIPLNNYHDPYASFFGGYLNIIHVRNPNIAFSIGDGLHPTGKFWLFIVLPIVVLAYIAVLIIRDKELHKFQRGCLAAILGGGIGNMIDRLFRPAGVVDFVDTDFWDIHINWSFFQFDMQRWPTYNVADASVLVGMTLLIIYTLFFTKKAF